jgi:hypothetical protein
MFRSVFNLLGQVRIGKLGGIALAVLVSVSGCSSTMNLRGEGYPKDELTGWVGQIRGTGEEDDTFVFSNKAKEISRNLGGSRPLR